MLNLLCFIGVFNCILFPLLVFSYSSCYYYIWMVTSCLVFFFLHQGQCADIREALQRHTRSSELTNQKLQKDFQEASSTTKALETKVEVLIIMHPSLKTIFKKKTISKLFNAIRSFWFVKEIKKVTEHFEKIQHEHRNTLLNLEREKKLRVDLFRAAQVRKVQLMITLQSVLLKLLTQVHSGELTEHQAAHSDSSRSFFLHCRSSFQAFFLINSNASLFFTGFTLCNCKEMWGHPGADQWPHEEEQRTPGLFGRVGKNSCERAGSHRGTPVRGNTREQLFRLRKWSQ